MLNKKMTIVIVISAAVISGTIAGLSSLATPSGEGNQPEKRSPMAGALPPPFPIMDLTDTLVTIQKAKELTNFKMDEPKYLPPDYDIDVISITPDQKSVTILASPKQITAETTNYQFFWEDKGILIHYDDKTGTAFNWERDGPDFGRTLNAHPITANGNPAVVHGQSVGKSPSGHDVPIMAELMMFRDGWTIVIRADLPEGELIRVAQSMY